MQPALLALPAAASLALTVVGLRWAVRRAARKQQALAATQAQERLAAQHNAINAAIANALEQQLAAEAGDGAKKLDVHLRRIAVEQRAVQYLKLAGVPVPINLREHVHAHVRHAGPSEHK